MVCPPHGGIGPPSSVPNNMFISAGPLGDLIIIGSTSSRVTRSTSPHSGYYPVWPYAVSRVWIPHHTRGTTRRVEPKEITPPGETPVRIRSCEISSVALIAQDTILLGRTSVLSVLCALHRSEKKIPREKLPSGRTRSANRDTVVSGRTAVSLREVPPGVSPPATCRSCDMQVSHVAHECLVSLCH